MRKFLVGIMFAFTLALFSSVASAAQTCGGINEVPCRLEFGEEVPVETQPEYELAPEFDLSGLLGFFTDIKGLSVDRPNTWVCEPMTAQIYWTTAYFSFHCDVLNIAHYILTGTFIAFWVILSLFIVMGA